MSRAPAPHLAPGRMGVRLAVLSVAIGLAAVNTGNNLLYVMLSLVLGLAGLSTIAARRALRTLRVRAHLPSEAVCGEPFLVTVEAAGRFPWLPQAWIDVTLAGLSAPVLLTVPLPAASGRGTATARVVAPRRGLHTSLPLTASTGYPLDLHLARHRSAWRGELVVLPRFEPIASLHAPSGADRSRLGQTAEARAVVGPGADLRNVRAYTWHDEARHIHWRATARAGSPMVRELDREHERRLDLALDLEAPDPEAFEAVVSRAAALLDYAQRERLAARLYAKGAPEAGLQGQEATRFLAMVTPRPGGSTGGWLDQGVPAGAIVLSCDASRATPIEVS